MKPALRVLTLLTGLACVPFSLPVPARAQATAEAKAEAMAGAKALLQKLFTQDGTEEELQALIKEANKIGVPRQQILEAKLIWGLRHQNTQFLVKILPEVEILASSFDSSTAAAIPNVEAVKAFVH